MSKGKKCFMCKKRRKTHAIKILAKCDWDCDTCQKKTTEYQVCMECDANIQESSCE